MKRTVVAAFGIFLSAGLSAFAAITAPESGQPVTVPAGETWTVESADDVATLNAAGEVVVSDGATLKFAFCPNANVAAENVAAATRLSGPGTVEFDYNSGATLKNSPKFKAQWDGSGLTGTVIVRPESSLQILSATCFGSARVIVYGGGEQYDGAIDFTSGTFVLDNPFDLYNYNYRPVLRAVRSDVTLRGPVTCRLATDKGVVRLTATMASGSEKGMIRLLGDVTASCGIYANMTDARTGGSTTPNRPLVVCGGGTADSTLDLGGFPVNSDCAVGTNVVACAVTNGSLVVSTGCRWQLAMDDPFRSARVYSTDSNGKQTYKDASAGFSWNGEAGGWVDLNGHHLLVGQWLKGNRWEGGAPDLSRAESSVSAGGFCNNAAKFGTVLFRQMMRGSATKHVRLQMDGNLNVAYDGQFEAGTTTTSSSGVVTYNDFDVNWPCWIGNYPNASSSMRGSLAAMRGALHLASSANYPNVARIVAQDKAAVYIHPGAQVNPAVSLCVEGSGRFYVAQDITVADLYQDGVRVEKEPGDYSTDDFDFLFANDGTTQGPVEGSTFKVTITGSKTPVARVGNLFYESVDDAVADAQGGIVELLANATFAPTMDFKVKTGDFTLTEDASAAAAFAGYRRTAGPDADGVTAYVIRPAPAFAGGNGVLHRLATADDYRELAYWTASGETFEDVVFSQAADVDWDAATDGAFAGVGSSTDTAKAFKGLFDGHGRTIRNLVLARTATGLFNRVTGGEVRNLTLDTVSFAAGEGICGGAAFVGTLTGGKVSGLALTGAFGTADSPLAAAGIVADATDAAIDGCTNTATVVLAAGGSAAGILGRAAGGTVTSAGGCRAPANLKSVGLVASGATCSGLALATVTDDGWADILAPEEPLAGINEYRLMCDFAQDITLSGTGPEDSSLTLDLTLGTTYTGRVRRNGKKLGRTVLTDPARLVFDRSFGLAVIIR